jgi:hypothetical protein
MTLPSSTAAPTLRHGGIDSDLEATTTSLMAKTMLPSNPDCFTSQPGTFPGESGSQRASWEGSMTGLEGGFRREGTASVGVASLLV